MSPATTPSSAQAVPPRSVRKDAARSRMLLPESADAMSREQHLADDDPVAAGGQRLGGRNG